MKINSINWRRLQQKNSNKTCEQLSVRVRHTSDVKGCILQAGLVSLPLTVPLLAVAGRAVVTPFKGGVSRKKQIKRALGRPLKNVDEAVAVEKAHYIGFGEIGADGKNLAGIGNYTQAQINEKARVLAGAGFTKEERRKLMEKEVVGFLPFLIGHEIGSGSARHALKAAEKEIDSAKQIARVLEQKNKQLEGQLDKHKELNQSAERIMAKIEEIGAAKELIDEIYDYRFASSRVVSEDLDMPPKTITEYRSAARKLGFSSDSEILTSANKREGVWKYSLDQLNAGKTMIDKGIFTKEEMQKMIQNGNADAVLRNTPEKMEEYAVVFARQGISMDHMLQGHVHPWIKHPPERLDSVIGDLESARFSQSQIKDILDSDVIAASPNAFKNLSNSEKVLRNRGFTSEDIEKIPKSVLGQKDPVLVPILSANAVVGAIVDTVVYVHSGETFFLKNGKVIYSKVSDAVADAVNSTVDKVQQYIE